jgi:hypothetical protein
MIWIVPGMGQRGFWDEQQRVENSKLKSLLLNDSPNRFLGNHFVHCSKKVMRKSTKAMLVGGELIR